MKYTLIGLVTGSALLIGSGIACAQNTKIMDANNPAPTPAPMAASGSNASTKIMDANNPAPTPGTMAASGKTASTKIMDANNPAPNPAGSVAPAARKHAAHKKSASHG